MRAVPSEKTTSASTRLTTPLLLYGIITGPFYIIVSLIQRLAVQGLTFCAMT